MDRVFYRYHAITRFPAGTRITLRLQRSVEEGGGGSGGSGQLTPRLHAVANVELVRLVPEM